MLCPRCGEPIDDELVKTEGARLMVASRADRQDQYAVTRRKIRELTEEIQKLQTELTEKSR